MPKQMQALSAPAALVKGAAVSARWPNDGRWYPGTVAKLNRTAAVIAWADGGTPCPVAFTDIRVAKLPSVTLESTGANRFKVATIPAPATGDDHAAILAGLKKAAAKHHAKYPQYKGHFDAYTLARAVKAVRVKGGAMAKGEYVLIRPGSHVQPTGPKAGRTFVVVWCPTLGIDTHVEANTVERIDLPTSKASGKPVVGTYVDTPINGNGPLFTRDCYIVAPDGGRLGGVDHFMKRSLKSLVTYYVNRGIREGWQGKHIVTVILGKGVVAARGERPTTLTVDIDFGGAPKPTSKGKPVAKYTHTHDRLALTLTLPEGTVTYASTRYRDSLSSKSRPGSISKVDLQRYMDALTAVSEANPNVTNHDLFTRFEAALNAGPVANVSEACAAIEGLAANGSFK